MSQPLEILVVAGEASGDAHAGALMRELSARRPELRFFGMGGKAMQAAGLEALYDAREVSVMGISEVLPKLLRILQVLGGLAKAAEQRQPALAILVDIPDFNLRLARRLRKLGIPVVYYVSPTVWAWRRGRIKQIARDVDTMLCILPFEEEFYRQHGVRAHFVGNPVVESVPAPAPVDEFRRRLGVDAERPTVALLPGSRMSEVDRVLPTMVEAVERLVASRPSLQVLLPVAPTIDRTHILRYFEGRKVAPVLVEGRAPEAVGASDAAIVCSGTATLEAGLMLRPFVVVYRVSLLTELIFNLFVRVAHVALVNLLAGRRLVPELLQRRFTAEGVAAEVASFLDDPARAEEVSTGLAAVRRSLGEGGASRRAADAVEQVLGRIAKQPPRVVTVAKSA